SSSACARGWSPCPCRRSVRRPPGSPSPPPGPGWPAGWPGGGSRPAGRPSRRPWPVASWCSPRSRCWRACSAWRSTMDADRLPLVLMYHSVEPYETDPYRVTVHPRRFDQQLRWLGRRGWRAVSMAELLTAREPGTVGLTFDDGYADFLTNVLPALARYGFTATVFVVAGSLGAYNAWDE